MVNTRKTLHRCFEARQVFININLNPLESVETFPYLGHTITYNNSNWEAHYHNTRKAQQRWEMVLKVLVKAGATV